MTQVKEEPQRKIVDAIHKVQQQLDILGRDAKADVGSYTYKYTPFPTMWTELKPLLANQGLTVIQSPVAQNGTAFGDFLKTEIYHKDGGYLEYITRLVITRDDPQGFGSAITYAERYMIKTIFKVVTDDDNDAVTQKMATGEMKREWVQAYTIVAKKQNPDHTVTNQEFVNFMTEVYGKHPSKVLAKEHDNVMGIIKAFDE